jgi:uncharacterized protein YjaZ
MKNIDRNKLLLILNWCENKFGKSKYRKSTAKLRVYKTNGFSTGRRYYGLKRGLCGHQSNDKIIIFLSTHRSMKELCKTIVHEYKHYLSSEKEWSMLYHKLKKQGLDDNKVIDEHPHEKEAIKFENKYGPICYKELKKELFNKNLTNL